MLPECWTTNPTKGSERSAASRTAILIVCTLVILGTAPNSATARAGIQQNAARIQHAIAKMLVVGRVLYIAAHPDDENTWLLSYLAGERKLDAGYLSITRGDGGQNLLGTEITSLLGVIRTHELLEARKLDGAWQFFTRAKDFGYSKSPDESMRIWGKKSVLGDMVWVIRRFRPDVIITRFPEKGRSHGHHIASARLAREAYLAAADPKRFPEQLKHVNPWRAVRLMHNVSQWMLRRRGLQNNKQYLARFLRLNVGGYNPLFGLSYGEIAARGRSMHKSQGFGVLSRRGPNWEYFEPLLGQKPKTDIVEGIDLSWRRFPGGINVARKLSAVLRAYQPKNPAASIPGLVDALKAMRRLAKDPRITDKIADIGDLIVACAGLVLDVRAKSPSVAPGGVVQATLSALNRSRAVIQLAAIQLPGSTSILVAAPLAAQKIWNKRVSLTIALNRPVSAPSWLRKMSPLGRYRIPDPTRVEQPVDPAPLRVRFVLRTGGETIVIVRPLRFVWRDRVRGELTRRVEVMPPITVTPVGKVVMLPNATARNVVLQLRATQPNASGLLTLRLPAGWSVTPNSISLAFTKAGEVRRHSFSVKPPTSGAKPGLAIPVVRSGGRDYSWREHTLRYPHIPVLSVLEPARIKLVPLALSLFKGRVGYISGSGDLVPLALRQIGLDLVSVGNEQLAGGDLSRFGAIVTGIRAFNTNRTLRAHRKRLFDWVQRGGTLIVQYNVSNRWRPLGITIGPFPLRIGRGRVTDERAGVITIDRSHRIWHAPNRIGPVDFNGWVQERGLYFAKSWDPRYRPLLRIADPGEKPQEGSLLVANHGKGVFVYSGLAFFRQLPAGVAGAYRLFMNLLSLKQSNKRIKR